MRHDRLGLWFSRDNDGVAWKGVAWYYDIMVRGSSTFGRYYGVVIFACNLVDNSDYALVPG